MKHFVVRPIQESDFAELKRLAPSVKGITTLPNNDEILKGKIADSLRAFSPHVRKPGGEAYLFALEDLDSHKLAGVSGIVSKVGGFDPFYTYKITEEDFICDSLKVKKKIKVLNLHINHNGPTEICSLLVDPSYRKHGLGKLISMSRFLFMAEFPQRFDKSVISELRGVVKPDGSVPFWDCIGRHFFDTDFFTADYMTGTGHKEVIANLMPDHPIYLSILPHAAQEVVGQVHEDTKPARALLEAEGFRFEDEVDIFDAGPTVSAKFSDIRTVRESQKKKILSTDAHPNDKGLKLICNAKLDFRCVLSSAEISFGGIKIPTNASLALGVKAGESLRYFDPKP